MTTERTFTVSQVNQAIGAALSESFPDPFWVVGELQGFDRDAAKASSRRWGQVYFELVEKEEGSDAAKAGAKALMWGDVRRTVAGRLAGAGSDIRLADGLKVKLLCAVDFYWPRASLQLKVMDVDPNFTLGDLEKSRRELVERLKREGLLDLNRTRPLPVAPRVIGLVTSEGSAAYHDFLQELRQSGLGFRVVLADARMQGEETEPSVLRAIRSLEADPSVEVLALVRGGGSRSDLMWFDREKIALAVAKCSKPVVTGIGHEIDLSVADLAAHSSHKTPTACARFLVERVGVFATGVEDASRRLAEGFRERLEQASSRLGEAGREWRRLAEGRLAQTSASLVSAGKDLVSWVRQHLSVRRERLAGAGPRLARAAASLLGSSMERLEGLGRELGLKDPLRLLARGYSLVHTAEGGLVKRRSQVGEGARVVVRVSDGEFPARVMGDPVSSSRAHQPTLFKE